jgi:hypothetical protein
VLDSVYEGLSAANNRDLAIIADYRYPCVSFVSRKNRVVIVGQAFRRNRPSFRYSGDLHNSVDGCFSAVIFEIFAFDANK